MSKQNSNSEFSNQITDAEGYHFVNSPFHELMLSFSIVTSKLQFFSNLSETQTTRRVATINLQSLGVMQCAVHATAFCGHKPGVKTC